MNYSIKVRAQFTPKIISGDLIVVTNKWIESQKKVRELKAGDDFIYNGALYTVETINPV